MRILLCISMLLAPFSLAAQEPDHSVSAAELIARPTTLFIGHRGASETHPENTLPAFRQAIEEQADLIELDYYHTADGLPVAFHDKTLDRTTDASQVLRQEGLRIADVHWDQLQRLDAGRWFADRFAGTRIPTLEASIELIQSGSVTLIEHKAGDAATCVELLRERGWLDSVVVQSFDWQYVADCHALAPQIALAALGSEELSDDKLDAIEGSGAQVVGWRAGDVRPEDPARVHARGLKLWTYTVNDVDEARRLVAAGVDGLITDAPGRLRRELGN